MYATHTCQSWSYIAIRGVIAPAPHFANATHVSMDPAQSVAMVDATDGLSSPSCVDRFHVCRHTHYHYPASTVQVTYERSMTSLTKSVARFGPEHVSLTRLLSCEHRLLSTKQ